MTGYDRTAVEELFSEERPIGVAFAVGQKVVDQISPAMSSSNSSSSSSS